MKSALPKTCGLVIASLILATTAGNAQQRIRLPNQPTCADCKIKLKPAVRLGSDEDPAGFAQTIVIAANSRNQYVVSSLTFDGQLFVYGPDGKFIRTIGHQGHGPGEFSTPQLMAFDSRDSLHTIDFTGSRYSVFAPNFSFVRSAVVPAMPFALKIHPTGKLVMATVSATRSGRTGLSIFPQAGGPALASFDVVTPNRAAIEAGRFVSIDATGLIWSTQRVGYMIRVWDARGREVREITAARPWTSDSIRRHIDYLKEKPDAQISGLEFDASGRLWVFAVVPDAHWAPVKDPAQLNMKRGYDTIIEVIDPVTGKLLAQARMDEVVTPFAKGLAQSMIEDANGELRIQIWGLQLTR
jgi:hypothetical protein